MMVQYMCQSCQFKTSKKYDYNRHLLTKKHRSLNYNRETDHITIFGKEKTNHITNDVMIRIIKRPFYMIQYLIKSIHIDIAFNNNIVMQNKSSSCIKVFTSNGWQNKNKKEFIDSLIEHYYIQINMFYILNEGCLNNPFYVANFNNFKTKYENKDDKLLEQLRKDIELIFINHSN